jgi:cbb3-type cytochrome oxidase maturation protein
MSVLYVVLPLALLASTLAVGAFVWSVRKGQLDDLDTPPLRALSDDTSVRLHDAGQKPFSVTK